VTQRRYAIAAALTIGAVLLAAAQKTAGAPAKSPAPKKTSPAGARSKKGAPKKKAAGRGQTRPTPERYKQIEQVLAARGYLKEEPTGTWSPGAAAALRQFQTDKNLPATGKLDARSLLELGLASPHERIPRPEPRDP